MPQNNKPKDPDFIEIGTIIKEAHDYVDQQLAGTWPEDDWITLGNWELNLWTDDETGQKYITAMPVTKRNALLDMGISIPADMQTEKDNHA